MEAARPMVSEAGEAESDLSHGHMDTSVSSHFSRVTRTEERESRGPGGSFLTLL